MSVFPSGAKANGLSVIYSKKLNAKFYAGTSLMEMCNSDWEGEIQGEGSKVIIRSRPDVAINDYTGTVTYQGLEPGKIELPIDQAKYYSFKDDYIQSLQSNIKEVDEATLDASENMKIVVETDVHAVMAANAGLTWGDTTAGDVLDKSNVLDFIVDMGTLLDENNVPESGRFLKLPPWVCGMIKKSELKDASLAGDGTSALRTGRLGMIDRFTIYNSNTLPTGGGKFNILAGTKHATAFASQFVNHETLTLESTFGKGHRGLKVYGRKVVKPEALVMAVVKKS
ncbi:hypothetical protein [Salinisphaera sp. G21_0]|uniref:hypothetical protein n=1 Tax=Salinisphaera sp. G21_0 TaxID=2821094 RepID=UPI001ADC04BF|nr:hypothetical protein [Salinisphaera sp. G21_0]MBO9483793.1 hypothetical protein [Salinisphaera sp. G21_0]